MNENKLTDEFREEELFKAFLEKNKLSSDSGAGDVKWRSDTETAVEEFAENPDPGFGSDEEHTSSGGTGSDVDAADDNGSGDDIISGFADLLPEGRKFSDADGKEGTMHRVPGVFLFFVDVKNCCRLVCIAFPVILLMVLLLNLVTPDREVSSMGSRDLTQFPEVSFGAIADGSFAAEFEKYVADQFIFRNQLAGLKRNFELFSGKKEINNVLICKDGYLAENISSITKDNIKPNLTAIDALSGLKRYDVTFAVLPASYEIMSDTLPSHAYTDEYGRFYEAAREELDVKALKIADIGSYLKKKSNEYLYYRTAPGQTAHGSYHTYSALAGYLGYEPYPIEDFEVEEVAGDFFGSLWNRSGFADVKGDTICRYTLKNPYEHEVIYPVEHRSMKSLYDAEKLNGPDKYSYYLGGDRAVTVIKSSCPSNKRLAIIKDSSALSLAPFLANHYSEIYMIDPALYSGDIMKYLYSSGVKDVLVLYSQDGFMTDTALQKISGLVKTSPYSADVNAAFGAVPERDAVDDSYFDDAFFVGDSFTLGFGYYSGLKSAFVCDGGLTTSNIGTKELVSGKTALDILNSESNIGKLYIMLGREEVKNSDPDGFIERYSKFIDSVRERFPNVVIYVQSIAPVSKKYEKSKDASNKEIETFNKRLLKMTADKKCYFVDVNSYLSGKDGCLPEEAGNDGVHLLPGNYVKLVDYLKKHTVSDLTGDRDFAHSPAKVNAEIDSSKPMVALTFDDGPLAGTTERILDVLEQYNARATFFVLGNMAKENPDILSRMNSLGCQIGNHTYSHTDLTTLTTDGIAEQIARTSNIVRNATGVCPELVRPPYGSENEDVLSVTLQPFILWSVDTYDWRDKNPERIADEIAGNVRDGEIILMHDIYTTTADAVEKIVPELVEKGVQLVTVSELYEHRGKSLEAHNVYAGVKK